MVKMPKQTVANSDVPCIYADDVANLSSSAGVLKFFLTRNDPPPEGEPEPVTRRVAQIVMPKAKLLEMIIFFQHSLAELEQKGSLYDDEVLKQRLRLINVPASDDSP